MAEQENNNSENMSKTLDFDISNLGERESIDMNEYSFLNTRIEGIELKYNEFTDKNNEKNVSYFLNIYTPNLNTSDSDMEIRARSSIKVYMEEDGQFTVSPNPDSHAQKILNYFEVNDSNKSAGQRFQDLIGKHCKTILKQKKDSNRSKLEIFFGQ